MKVCGIGCHLSVFCIGVSQCSELFAQSSCHLISNSGSKGWQLCCVCLLLLVTAALAAGRLTDVDKKNIYSINAMVGLLLGIKKIEIYNRQTVISMRS